MHRPALILDKSAFQALSRDEHVQRLKRYRENITPILLREIHADLAKQDGKKSPDEVVRILAAKFLGSGGVINVDHRKLCEGDLTGMPMPKADGRPLVDDFTELHESDGSTSILIDPSPANMAMLRWARAAFSAGERVAASQLRASAGAFGLDALHGRLRQHHVVLPRPRNVAGIEEIVRDLLARPTLQAAFLDWLMEQLRLPPAIQRVVGARWVSAGRPRLATFAPYAHHCTKVLLLVLVGMRHGVLSARKTNRLDAEYLFYAPFCEVFVSGDKIHEQLAPMVLGASTRFIPLLQFKAEMARHVAERAGAKGVDAESCGAR